MQERRTEPRKRSFLKGTVYFNNRLSSLECVVRDFTDHGARLEFAAAVSLPDAIELHIPTRDQTLRAQVRWRKEQEVGVSFATAAGAAPANGDINRRVEALEHDVARLQRLVQDLRTDLRSIRGEN